MSTRKDKNAEKPTSDGGTRGERGTNGGGKRVEDDEGGEGSAAGGARWKKLQAGFRSEKALLLVYLSAGGLARLAAIPDGLFVLSPDGFEPESSIGQGIIAATERGVPVLGVVRERWTPPPVRAGAEPMSTGQRLARTAPRPGCCRTSVSLRAPLNRRTAVSDPEPTTSW